MKTSEMINELAKALSIAQGQMPILKKENTVKMELKSGRKIEYDYLELGAIINQSKTILFNNSLSIVQPISTVEGKPALFTILMHSSGQYIQTYVLLDLAGKTEQEKGSAITYNSRYNYVGMLRIGLLDEDDDGQNASEPKLADYVLCNGKAGIKGKALKELTLDQVQKILDDADAYFEKQGSKPFGSVRDDLNACHNYLTEQAELKDLK